MKLQRILFGLLIFLLPIQLGKHFWPEAAFVLGIRVDYLSPTIYLTDLLVLGILGLWGIEKLKIIPKNSKNLIFPFLVFCFLLVSSFLAQNQGAALYKLLKIIELSLLGLYVTKNKLPITNYQLPMTLALAYSSLIAIAQFLKQGSLGGFFWWLGERTFNAGTPGIALIDLGGRLFLRPYGTFSHPNSMAGFLLVALVLVWGTSSRLKITSIALGLTALLLSFSRAGWLAGILVALWVVANSLGGKRFQRRPILFTIYYLLFAMLVVSVFLFFLNLNDSATQERIQLTKASLAMIQTSPLIGVGLNNFVVRLSEFWPESHGIYLLQPVHNIFLLAAAETGLMGFVISLWVLYLTLKRVFLRRLRYLSFVLGVILITGLFDHYWFTLQQNMLLLAIVFGLGWGKIKT